MKKYLLAGALLCNLAAVANQGGPDAFGYTWKDSNENGGPTYQWFDITGIGTQVNGLADDNYVGPLTLGFQFPYYWTTESKIWIGSNGYIAFGPGNIAANFPAIPDPGGVNGYIAGMMADLNFLGNGNTGQVFYYANTDTVCVEFLNVPYWDQTTNFTGSNTFEIILNRADSTITVNFMSCTGFSISNFSSGIENKIGTMGLQPLVSQPPNANYTIRYYFPTSNVPNIVDASVDWNHQTGNGGIFLANQGNPHQLVSQVKNSGNTSIGPVIGRGTVRTLANVLQASSYDTSLALTPGQVDILSFPQQYVPSNVGTKKFVTRLSGVSGDLIAVNDSMTQEIVVVDTTAQSVRLCYTNGHFESVAGIISWGGGQGGVGIYVKPPGYPAKILNTNYILTGAPTAGPAFYAKIYDDNGPGGSAGTLLDSVLVDASQCILNQVMTVPVSNPNLIINSGGFYINWAMASPNVTLGTSLTPPFSLQTYEVIGLWSGYRDAQNTDFFIGADVNYTYVGVEEHAQQLEGISVYPVPATDILKIAFEENTNAPVTLTVYGLDGKATETRTVAPAVNGTVIPVDVRNYAAGIYFFDIKSGDRFRKGKFVVTK